MPVLLFWCFAGPVAGDVRRLLANDLGAAFTDDCHDDKARGARPGEDDILVVVCRHASSWQFVAVSDQWRPNWQESLMGPLFSSGLYYQAASHSHSA